MTAPADAVRCSCGALTTDWEEIEHCGRREAICYTCLGLYCVRCELCRSWVHLDDQVVVGCGTDPMTVCIDCEDSAREQLQEEAENLAQDASEAHSLARDEARGDRERRLG